MPPQELTRKWNDSRSNVTYVKKKNLPYTGKECPTNVLCYLCLAVKKFH